MATYGKLWAGRIFGTNTGNFLLDLKAEGEKVSGTLRLLDNLFGLTVYEVTGSFDQVLKLKGNPTHASPGVQAGQIEAEGRLTPEGVLRGTWKSTLGTAGTFEAFPHDMPPPDQRKGADVAPEQLYTSNIQLGAIRIYAEDLWEVISFIRKDFVVGRPVITYASHGNEVTKYLEDFQKEAPKLGDLGRFKLTIQEPEAYGINKIVVVELSAAGQNEIRVQGINESWVVGKAEAISRTFRKFESKLVTTYKKFGLNINSLVFLGMLVVIPDIESRWERAVFIVVVLFLLLILYWMHSKFIPSAKIYMSEKKPKWWKKGWPAFWSWVSAIAAVVIGGLILKWLT